MNLEGTIADCIQGSPEWIQARVSCITASRMTDVLARLKNGNPSQKRIDYRTELVCERLTGRACEHFVSKWMERGTELEPDARAEYEIVTDVLTEQVGFIIHPTIKMFGASPDALVGDEGMAEFKCPDPTTHIEYLLAGVVPEEYQPQLLAQLSCNPERQWVDFCSYCPEMPKHLRLFKVRFSRDDARIAALEDAVRQFNAEVEALIGKLNALKS